MAAKKKRIKTTLIDLNTGKKTISYFDTDKPPKPPEWLTAQKALTDRLNIIKPPELLTAHKALADRLNFSFINSRWAKITQIGIIINPDFIGVVNRINKANTLGETLQKLYKQLAWVYELKEQNKDNKPVSNGKARMIRKGKKELKASNQILGLVCYFAGLFTPQQVREFLTNIMKVEAHKAIVKDVSKYRNKFHKFDYRTKTVREIQAFLGVLVCAYELMTEYKIKGKRKATYTRKAIERIFFENKTGLLYQE